MAVEEYRRRLEIHKKKLAFGQDLLEVVKQSSTLKVGLMAVTNHGVAMFRVAVI